MTHFSSPPAAHSAHVWGTLPPSPLRGPSARTAIRQEHAKTGAPSTRALETGRKRNRRIRWGTFRHTQRGTPPRNASERISRAPHNVLANRSDRAIPDTSTNWSRSRCFPLPARASVRPKPPDQTEELSRKAEASPSLVTTHEPSDASTGPSL